MKEPTIMEQAEKFFEVLARAQRPQLRCHPSQESHCRQIVEKINSIPHQRRVNFVVDEWLPADRIWAFDEVKMQPDWKTWSKQMENEKPLPYSFSWNGK